MLPSSFFVNLRENIGGWKLRPGTNIHHMGVPLNGGTPPKWSFLVGKPMVVGETHHFRKLPYTSIQKLLWKRMWLYNFSTWPYPYPRPGTAWGVTPPFLRPAVRGSGAAYTAEEDVVEAQMGRKLATLNVCFFQVDFLMWQMIWDTLHFSWNCYLRWPRVGDFWFLFPKKSRKVIFQKGESYCSHLWTLVYLSNFDLPGIQTPQHFWAEDTGLTGWHLGTWLLEFFQHPWSSQKQLIFSIEFRKRVANDVAKLSFRWIVESFRMLRFLSFWCGPVFVLRLVLCFCWGTQEKEEGSSWGPVFSACCPSF